MSQMWDNCACAHVQHAHEPQILPKSSCYILTTTGLIMFRFGMHIETHHLRDLQQSKGSVPAYVHVRCVQIRQTGKNPCTTLDASDTPMRRNSAQAILRRNLTRFAPKILGLFVPNLTTFLSFKRMYTLIYAINTTNDGETCYFNTVPPRYPPHADLMPRTPQLQTK